MRYYLIDEVASSDIEKIDVFLKEKAIGSTLERLYWVKIPSDLLNSIQSQHNGCQPFVFAVELGTDHLKMEFFIRSLNKLQCVCQEYCTLQQRDFIFNFSQKMIEDLGIKT